MKNNKMKLNLNYKITFTILLIIICILVGIYFYLQKTFTESTFQRIRSTLIRESALAKYIVEKNLPQELSSREADSLIDKIGSALDLRATIISLDGTVLGDSDIPMGELKGIENHSDRPEIREAYKEGIGESRRFSTTLKKDLLYMARTFGEDNVRGIIRLAIPLSEIGIIHNRIRNILFISLFIAFLIAVIFSLCASNFITRPIKEMAFMAQSIARGNFSSKIHINTNDEIEDLSKAFNDMAQQVKVRIDEITSNKLKLEVILLSMFDGVIVVDGKGKIILMNNALKQLLRVEGDPLGKKPIEVVRNIEIQAMIDSVLDKEEGVTSCEISIVLPQEKTFIVHATPVIREGRREGSVLVFHDITDLKRLERVRTDFVANVSHELRTPLSTIKGYAETLLEGAVDDKKNAREFLKIINEDANRLAHLVNDLLDLSKIESGKFSLVLKPVKLFPIIERVLGGFKKQTANKSINVSSEVPDSISSIIADEDSIAQVLMNLLDNAINYTPEGGNITVSAHEEKEVVKVSISDTGIGIPAKDLARIFERFYRVDKARSRKLGGTGLGLSIVKHIVQAHYGTVSVESMLGEGSTFSFTIPKA